MIQRTKWKLNQQQLKDGALVLIKEENTPPLCWKLGRIIKLHPGPDKISRVATVQTSTGECKRSFSRLCPLPVETFQ
ncbi:hypothetical protein NQ314_017263 [Rhamnusium bicolor]|uniref:DUF5641 domain-containing protein n=1 Tax=Rhamnusium bicolor TaxID=1586634 RepID=A0AAV8WUT6_9CUCU|nr:hypothetical protein NQ314_017263 [Rhamnusium bicolor]